jgi:hypothetical protein
MFESSKKAVVQRQPRTRVKFEARGRAVAPCKERDPDIHPGPVNAVMSVKREDGIKGMPRLLGHPNR